MRATTSPRLIWFWTSLGAGFLPTDSAQDIDTVAEAFSFAYKNVKKQVVQNTVLAPLGLSLNSFIRRGRESLGDQNFTLLLQKVQATVLGCEFLVCGFDSKSGPHIFTMSDDGEPKIYDRAGCWAIGSGQQSALSSLFFHSYNRNYSVWAASYHVCEAKFMAESAMGVGKLTFLSIFGPGQSRGYIFQHNIDEIRRVWEAYGKPKVPEEILGRIQSMIEIPDRRNAKAPG